MSTIYTQYTPIDSIFINNILTISQSVDIYGQHLLEREFDYTFRINVNSLVAEGATNGITSLFSNASFTENSLNPQDFNVNLTLADHANFTNWSTLFNNTNKVTVVQGLSATNFGTFNATTNEKIGDRLLEVIAHKLFGHAQARAAIKNDDNFYTHDAAIWDHLAQSVTATSFRKDVFNQYVKLGRYNTASTSGAGVAGNDFGGHVNFNFADITLDFPLQLNGSMLFDPSLTTADRELLKLGPEVGGSRLTDGNYDVPILIRFHT
jgi:hypothetical protein